MHLAPTAALLAAFLTACSSSPKTAEKPETAPKTDRKLYAVVVDDAAFFRRGPQTGREPDQKLSKETLVRLIRPSFGYCKVELVASREQGYISNDDIKPATSGLIASFAPPKVDPLRDTIPTPSAEPAGEQFNLNSSDPRLVPPPEDLPPSELPQPDSSQ